MTLWMAIIFRWLTWSICFAAACAPPFLYFTLKICDDCEIDNYWRSIVHSNSQLRSFESMRRCEWQLWPLQVITLSLFWYCKPQAVYCPTIQSAYYQRIVPFIALLVASLPLNCKIYFISIKVLVAYFSNDEDSYLKPT